jgi:predicted Fe-S protein YdhL (DUF1289 family)
LHLLGYALETPCLKICTYEPGAGVCLGCGRTLAEIAGWAALSDHERQRIMAELPARLAKVKSASS